MLKYFESEERQKAEQESTTGYIMSEIVMVAKTKCVSFEKKEYSVLHTPEMFDFHQCRKRGRAENLVYFKLLRIFMFRSDTLDGDVMQ